MIKLVILGILLTGCYKREPTYTYTHSGAGQKVVVTEHE